MDKASGLPKAEPKDKGGYGSYPAPQSAMLRDDARTAPAMAGSENRVPSPSLRSLAKDPEVPIRHSCRQPSSRRYS